MAFGSIAVDVQSSVKTSVAQQGRHIRTHTLHIQKAVCHAGQRPDGGLGRRFALSHGGEIGLDLGLSAAGAHHELAAPHQPELQHVRFRQAGALGGVVYHLLHRLPGDGLGRVAAQAFHQPLHGVHAALPLKGETQQVVFVPAELVVEGVDGVQQGLALLCVPSRRLADQQGGVHRVLVPHMGAGEIAVALFKAEDEPLFLPRRFQQADLLADELEAGEGAAQLHTVFLADGIRHVGGDDGGHRHRGGGQSAQRGAGAADVVQQDDAHLVAGDEPVTALAVRYGGAAAVAVRVGAQQKVRLHFIAQFQPLLHGLPNLRVGVRAGGEIAVRLFLFRHHGAVGHAQLGQQFFHALKARAVQRGVDQFQVRHALAAAHPLGIHRLHKGVDALLGDIADGAFGQRFVEAGGAHVVEAVHRVDAGQDLPGGVQGDLAAVRAVDLVAVVLGGVVAGGDAHARPAAQIPHRPGQGGGGLQAGVEPGGDAVGRQHPGRFPGEQLALAAAVVGDGNALVQAGSLEVVGQALGGLAHGVDVHAVGARADDAPQAAGAELQLTVKAVVQAVFVLCLLQRGQLPDKVRVFRGVLQPTSQLICHQESLFHFNLKRARNPSDRFRALERSSPQGNNTSFVFLPRVSRQFSTLLRRSARTLP